LDCLRANIFSTILKSLKDVRIKYVVVSKFLDQAEIVLRAIHSLLFVPAHGIVRI
jgi:hypothetical protein